MGTQQLHGDQGFAIAKAEAKPNPENEKRSGNARKGGIRVAAGDSWKMQLTTL